MGSHNIYQKQVLRTERAEKLKMDLFGEGIFLFENNSSGDLFLPKPAKSGKTLIPKGGQFQGDSYFMKLVKTHDLKLIKIIEQPPLPAVLQKPLKEEVKNSEKEKVETPGESKMLNESKLLLDQPEQFTPKGKVEHVTSNKSKKKINESKTGNKNSTDVLINEDPSIDSGIEILLN